MLPTREQALDLLNWAGSLNPGPWKLHVLSAARAAETIAAAAGLDPERAFVSGALHDIGRYEGPSYARHMTAGAKILREKGFDEIARICLTHSFPDHSVANYIGKWDISPEEKAELSAFIESAEYDDYDRLIQLCDALSLPTGVCLIEKRLVDVALRHGAFAGLERKWRAFLDIRKYFEKRIGRSIYALFPEVVENTFSVDV